MAKKKWWKNALPQPIPAWDWAARWEQIKKNNDQFVKALKKQPKPKWTAVLDSWNNPYNLGPAYHTPEMKPPTGKVGFFEDVWTGARQFQYGNVKFRFHKFIDAKNKKNGKGIFNSPENYIKALRKRGFEVLGMGAYSTVLGKEKHPRVIKVNRRPDNWIDYIQWAAQLGQCGKFAPQVYSYRVHKKKRNFSVSIVERLEYTIGRAPEDHAMKIVPVLLSYSKKNEMATKFVETLVPGLRDFYLSLREKFGYVDFHEGNLMIRKDGTFVIADPVCGSLQTDTPRLRAGAFAPVLLIVRIL